MTPKRECLVIVGVGLIGGSIGLAARRTEHFGPIIGVGRDATNLERARITGCVDEHTLDLIGAVQRADVAVFCTPVDRIAEQVLSATAHCRAGTLITDVGSTKAEIVSAIEGRLPLYALFVGSHPLAGSEKKGAEYARADLFDQRLTLVTPTRRTPQAAVERATAFWQALGSRVKLMSPDKHDEALALTSHLPHVVAAALAGTLPPDLFEIAASGFRDTTRLAAGDPALWTAILQQNGRNIASAIEVLQERVIQFKAALLAGDAEAIARLLVEAKKVRDDLGS